MKRLLSVILSFLICSCCFGEPAMKILGPDGQDITGNIQQLIEDNPAMMMEMSRAFNSAKQAANSAQKKAGQNDGDTELFVNWAVQLNEDGTMDIVDQGNPETCQQFPVAGGARMFNACVMRRVKSSIAQGCEGSDSEDGGLAGITDSGNGAASPLGQAGLSDFGNAFPTADNGFSADGYGSKWGPNSSGNLADSGFGDNIEVTTSSNKVDIGVQDVSPPRLFFSLDSADGRPSSSLSVQAAQAHEPVVSIPEDTTLQDFYKNQSISPFKPQDLIGKGLVQGKQRSLIADGTLFNPEGTFEQLKTVVRSEPDAYAKNFNTEFDPGNLGEIKAIFVPQNVRIKIQADATDEDEVFEEIHPEPGEELDRYNQATTNLGLAYQRYINDMRSQENAPTNVLQGNDDYTATFPGIKPGSLKWKVVQRTGGTEVEYASPSEPKAPLHVLFRKHDFKSVDEDPDNCNFMLVGEVEDQAGNKTALRIPIWVTATSFNPQTIQSDQNRTLEKQEEQETQQ